MPIPSILQYSTVLKIKENIKRFEVATENKKNHKTTKGAKVDKILMVLRTIPVPRFSSAIGIKL